jgi:hypothetical protein
MNHLPKAPKNSISVISYQQHRGTGVNNTGDKFAAGVNDTGG